jgi:hypothetical protein
MSMTDKLLAMFCRRTAECEDCRNVLPSNRPEYHANGHQPTRRGIVMCRDDNHGAY